MRIFFAIFLFALTLFAQEPDPIIEAARVRAAKSSRSVPDYLVERITVRYKNTNHPDLKPLAATPQARHYPTNPDLFWRIEDSFSAEITSEGEHEAYTNIKVNGKPATALPEDGVWSALEFSGLLGEILSPERHAVFTDKRSDTVHRRPAWRYNFSVDEEHSGWMVQIDVPEYTGPSRISAPHVGSIWIDQETSDVLRIERSVRRLPEHFPLRLIESATDYSAVKIGEESYVLPTQSEIITCATGRTNCFKNETTFRNYRKFEANTRISFQ